MPGTAVGAQHNEQVKYETYIPSLQFSESEMENKDVNKCTTINNEKFNEKKKELCSLREVGMEE